MNADRPPARLSARLRSGSVALAAAAMLPSAGLAQGPVSTRPAPPQAPVAVPTTKVLAIGSFTADAKPADWQPMLPDEVRATVRLYLNGKIDQWFVKQDQSGVVFVMNVTDVHEAKELLHDLPFGKNKIMTFALVPLGPLSPLGSLLKPGSN